LLAKKANKLQIQSMPKRSVCWKMFQAFPPIMVRLMARSGRGRGSRGLTTEEIALTGELDLQRVKWIECQTSWKKIDLIEAEAFCRGCKFDPTSSYDRTSKWTLYLAACEKSGREPWWYLKNSKEWPQYQKWIHALELLTSSLAK
jgi:hypothetical protein